LFLGFRVQKNWLGPAALVWCARVLVRRLSHGALSDLVWRTAMSAPELSNVRLTTILAASLLAGYAGDEAYNVWWGRGELPGSAPAAVQAGEPVSADATKLALAERLQIAK